MRLAWAWLVAAACGEGGELTIGDYVTAYRDAYCRREVRCGLLPDLRSCALLHPVTPLHPDLIAAVDGAIVQFHPDLAQACVDAIDRLGCDPTAAEYKAPVCFGIFTGALHKDDSCAFATECISAECWFEGTCTDACCRGTCTGDIAPTIGLIGDRCRLSACAEGFCDGSVCVPLLGEGASCTRTRECDIGLSCAEGICTALPPAGEPCTSACRDLGYACNSLTYRCERAGFIGAACGLDSDCSPYYRCGVMGTCELHLSGVGEACWADPCEPSLVCGGFTQFCAAPKGDGEPCETSSECASHSCDDRGTCTSDRCI